MLMRKETDMKKLRTLIIGAGGIAAVHALALNKLSNIEVSGVMDINRENAAKIARICKAPVFIDVDEALQEADMVHLLTPPAKRVDYALKAIRTGKHIICEKPIAARLDEARQIVVAARENGTVLMPAFNHRFRDGYEQLRQTVKSGRLGEVVNVWSYRLGAGSGFGKYALSRNWRTDPDLVCGMTIESLSHDIDMLNGLAGRISEVSANVTSTISQLPEFDNNAGVCCRLENGGTALIHASWSSHISYNSRGVIGTKGTAMIQGNDLWDFDVLRIRTDDMTAEETVVLNDRFAGIEHYSYLNENVHFIDCLINGSEPKVQPEDGLYALQVSLAILEASKEKRTVAIDR